MTGSEDFLLDSVAAEKVGGGEVMDEAAVENGNR